MPAGILEMGDKTELTGPERGMQTGPKHSGAVGLHLQPQSGAHTLPLQQEPRCRAADIRDF